MLRRNGQSVGMAQDVATDPGAASRRRGRKFKPTHRQILALAVESVPALGPGGRLAIGPGPFKRPSPDRSTHTAAVADESATAALVRTAAGWAAWHLSVWLGQPGHVPLRHDLWTCRKSVPAKMRPRRSMLMSNLAGVGTPTLSCGPCWLSSVSHCAFCSRNALRVRKMQPCEHPQRSVRRGHQPSNDACPACLARCSALAAQRSACARRIARTACCFGTLSPWEKLRSKLVQSRRR